MATISLEELSQLIRGGESNTCELKAGVPRQTDLAERLCGMANAHGGVVILGVADDRRIVGVRNSRQAVDRLLLAARQIEPTLVFSPPEPEIYTIGGKHVVVATIPRNGGHLYQARGVCWTRRGTMTVPLTVSEVLEVGHDRGLVSWERSLVHEARIADIDAGRVERYLAIRSAKSRKVSSGSLADTLLGLGCARKTDTGEVVPTNAGILFFGRDPQQFLLQSEVVCVLFHNTMGTGGYADRAIVYGTVVDLIDGTEAFLQKHLTVGARIVGWKRVDLPEYPIDALREAVVNAIVHRDYSRQGEAIRVFYYPDRLEVHSPGLLLPGITIERMQRGEVMSKPRNPVLATLLRDIPGYMERMGSGIRLMLQETEAMGLPAPIFRETEEFVVTFCKETESSLEGQLPPSEEASLETRLLRCMRYVQEHGSITNSEYRRLNSVSDNTALRDLEMLVSQGALVPVGKARARKYKLP